MYLCSVDTGGFEPILRVNRNSDMCLVNQHVTHCGETKPRDALRSVYTQGRIKTNIKSYVHRFVALITYQRCLFSFSQHTNVQRNSIMAHGSELPTQPIIFWPSFWARLEGLEEGLEEAVGTSSPIGHHP